ncbi:MAG: pyruvate, phosphate dikinase [Terriglobia bacterium]
MAKRRKRRSPAATGRKGKYVYFFADGKAEGRGTMKELLGGKGAGLAEMTNAGLPVPPGFTIATSACRHYFQNKGRLSAPVQKQIAQALKRLEKVSGYRLGSSQSPLLVSVRSGAKFSMPGMMDTILNLGLNDRSVEGLAAASGDLRFARDCYRRFIQMFGNIVLDIDKKEFDEIFDRVKRETGAKLDTDLDAAALGRIIARYQELTRERAGQPFPQDPSRQLRLAIEAVFRSWNNPRAKTYRRMHKISEALGTAVNVQMMVFGNLGEKSGTGVGFTRNPSTGAKEFYGEFLPNAQGEDVVAGIRTPLPVSQLKSFAPQAYAQLKRIAQRLERHYRDMQDFEYTIQDGKLYMLQTRTGKRTGRAALKIAYDMVQEKLIRPREALLRVEPAQLEQLLHPVIDESQPLEVLAKGLPASPGAAVGRAVFTADEAAAQGEEGPVILVRTETVPDDIHGMEAAVGILTSRGGMTSHAAVVARGMGKPCVAGCEAVRIQEAEGQFSVDARVVKRGEWISLDGSTGRLILGKVATTPPNPEKGEFAAFMSWADRERRLGVRANADIPRDAQVARQHGAEGIGLCRTEHMFFAEDRLPHVQAMILAEGEEKRREALSKLLPMQREDFKGLFKVMDGLPVTIRLLDPPLHEFLPRRENLMVEIERLKREGSQGELEEKRRILERVEQLHEFNPMLGHRGCRVGITHPEITAMQARAIFEAACEAAAEGVEVLPEVMIPLVGDVRELALQRELVDHVARQVFAEQGRRVRYLVGTMIELPRAALTAAEIARQADFFSFGTNDLTQTTWGLSRDDSGRIIREYGRLGIFPDDPFQVLDAEGVGKLVELGTRLGRSTRPKLKVGICGEHGGEPSSVEFCHRVGLDYVSCSPYRVPIARLAAAQAVLKEKQGEKEATGTA